MAAGLDAVDGDADFGLWLVGAGLNYLPLAMHALTLIRPGALEAELAGVDTRREIRPHGIT